MVAEVAEDLVPFEHRGEVEAAKSVAMHDDDGVGSDHGSSQPSRSSGAKGSRFAEIAQWRSPVAASAQKALEVVGEVADAENDVPKALVAQAHSSCHTRNGGADLDERLRGSGTTV